MAEISGSSYRSRAEERMRENARRALAGDVPSVTEERREAERQRRERAEQKRKEQRRLRSSQDFSEPGVLEARLQQQAEQSGPERSRVRQEQRLREVRQSPRERGMASSAESEETKGLIESIRRTPPVPLPGERMMEEAEEAISRRFSPLPPPATSVGEFLTQPIVFAFNQYELNKKAAENNDKPYEDQIRETIFGSGHEEYGHPEPGQSIKGTLGKPPHPTFRREYVNAYNEFSNQMREGRLIPRGVDVQEFDLALDEAEQALLAKLDRRAQGFMYTFVFGGNPTRRYIPAQELLDAYNNGRPDEFNRYMRALAQIQARRQAKADFYQVFGAQEEDIQPMQGMRDRAAQRAADRRGFRE